MGLDFEPEEQESVAHQTSFTSMKGSTLVTEIMVFLDETHWEINYEPYNFGDGAYEGHAPRGGA